MAMTPAGGARGAIAPTMNVTPLVDVVLVLLIIFMVVTPLLKKQFWLNLPKKDEAAQPAPPSTDKPVVLSVDRAGTIRVNRDVVSKAELRGKLQRVFAARADGVLYFEASDDAPYGAAVDVMDIARQGGARSIAILTEKPAQ